VRETERSIRWWIFFTLLSGYVLVGRGHFVGTDEIGLYQQTRSLYERRELAIGGVINSFPGRDGRPYSQYTVGQSVLALPLYGLGALVRRHGGATAQVLCGGPPIGDEPSRWGGDVEIFFVVLFNAFITAAIAVVFYAATRRLGATPRSAAIGALLVGATTQLAVQATQFLQHPLEALLILGSLHLLIADSEEPQAWRRLSAGALLGLLANVRPIGVLAAAPLAAFFLVSAWRRGSPARDLGIFGAPIVVGVLAHASAQWLKFGSIAGRYNNEGFHTPIVTGLFGYLFSPGLGIFWYSPLLLLAPWLGARLWRRRRNLALVVAAISIAYLGCFSTYTAWHGLWSAFGPRYLTALVPLLLLPLPWLLDEERRALIAVVPLAAAGLVMQGLGTALNFAFVYNSERWPDQAIPHAFLFVPALSPPAAYWRHLWAGQSIDLWLLNGARVMPVVAAALAAVLVLTMVCGLWRIRTLTR
jgi:hypothetical protein